MPTPDLARSCAGKKQYSTESMARRVAHQCWDERQIDLRTYQCPDCGCWHLTKRDAEPMMRPGYRAALAPQHVRDREKYGKKRKGDW